MAILSYGGVNLGNSRTMYYVEEPVYDDQGNVDPLMVHVKMRFQTILNPYWLSSNVILGAGNMGVPKGDAAGLSLVRLRKFLETPRLQLIYAVGPDRVIATPGLDPSDPNRLRLCQSDCKNGPLPTVIQLHDNHGDRSIFLDFEIETWISNTQNVLLSNRWSIVSDTGFDGLTTRTIRGQATVRSDALNINGFSGPDDFRRFLFIECPNNFIRESPKVILSEDGCTVNYEVVDVETGLTVGVDSVIVEMEGCATSGSESVIKDLPTLTHTIFSMIRDGFSKNIGGVLDTMVKSCVPQNKANAVIRVFANRGPTVGNVPKREALARIAARVCADRFGNAMITSAYLAQGLDMKRGPWVELRIEYFVTIDRLVGNFNPLDFSKQFNSMSDDIIVGDGAPTIFGNNPNAQNPPQPSGNNTRGSWLGALVAQTFAPAGAVPNPPPPTRNANVFGPF